MNVDRDARAALAFVSEVVGGLRKGANLLDEIAWPRTTEETFFRAKGRALPEVTYDVDRDAIEAEATSLTEAIAQLEGEGPVAVWLREVLGSARDRGRLLLAVGTPEFGRISHEIYGGATSAFFGLTNLDLANHVLERIRMHGTDVARDRVEKKVSAEEFGAFALARAEKRGLTFQVVFDENCTSKALAGQKRLRVRPDASFAPWETEGLYHHEIETHLLSAQNGAAQPHAKFLKAGGPRTTQTQEGLAVFSELYHHALGTPRLRRLALRVKLVAMAQEGANFLDVYRMLVEDEGLDERDAYLDTARIFRGGIVAGGSAFTKDVSYLAGLLKVHTFLSVFVRGGFRDETELLLVGRIDLEDLPAMLTLHKQGLLERPAHRPKWLREWNTLLPYFAFSSFFRNLDLAPVEAHYADVIKLATGG